MIFESSEFDIAYVEPNHRHPFYERLQVFGDSETYLHFNKVELEGGGHVWEINQIRSRQKGAGTALFKKFAERVGKGEEYYIWVNEDSVVDELMDMGLIEEAALERNEYIFGWGEWMNELKIPHMLKKAGLTVDVMSVGFMTADGTKRGRRLELTQDKKGNWWSVAIIFFGNT